MKKHLNTLYITQSDIYLKKERESLVAVQGDSVLLRVPIHHLDSLVIMGNTRYSSQLVAHLAESNVTISLMTEYGKFLAKITGPTTGNVLLRRTQYQLADDPEMCILITRNILSAKFANSKHVLRRSARDASDERDKSELSQRADRIALAIRDLDNYPSLDCLRGLEGDTANTYFQAFNHLIRNHDNCFQFTSRSKRPPLDPINAMLSFTYSLLANDLRSACEVVGLDPAVGFYHQQRPGRPSLALDLMEEFRAYIADRVTLTLINRKQVNANDFIRTESGAVNMSEAVRKTIITTYQQRKAETITHPYLKEKTTIGILPLIQAKLLARFLRGDLETYPPFFAR